VHIIVVIFRRLGERFADIGEGGEVHHRVGPIMGQDIRQSLAVAEVADFERAP